MKKFFIYGMAFQVFIVLALAIIVEQSQGSADARIASRLLALLSIGTFVFVVVLEKTKNNPYLSYIFGLSGQTMEQDLDSAKSACLSLSVRLKEETRLREFSESISAKLERVNDGLSNKISGLDQDNRSLKKHADDTDGVIDGLVSACAVACKKMLELTALENVDPDAKNAILVTVITIKNEFLGKPHLKSLYGNLPSLYSIPLPTVHDLRASATFRTWLDGLAAKMPGEIRRELRISLKEIHGASVSPQGSSNG